MSLGGFARKSIVWLPALAVPALVLSGVRLRQRARRFPVVGGPARSLGTEVQRPRRWILADGVTIDESTRASVAAYAEANGLDVVDVIPGDLAFDAAIDLLRIVDPVSYKKDRLALGRGAGQAILAATDVLTRAGVAFDDAVDQTVDPVTLLAIGVRLKKFAPATTALVVVPSARAASVGGRRARIGALEIPRHIALTGSVFAYAALVAGAVANPAWGVGALAAFSLQPYLAFAGTPIKPRGLHRAALLRVVEEPLRWVRTAFGDRGAVATAAAAAKKDYIATARRRYAADIAAGVERYLEPRRNDCPWCGSTHLSRLMSMPDLHQGKPGTFTLERCGACEHIFQNPRLTIDGLEFYYRDFYDGYGENALEVIFGIQGQNYRDRAEMLRPHTSGPRTWLDVGGGHGHFCAAARDVWPKTIFDGLDMSESIEEAERRGWVDRGMRGMFPELAPGIAGSYDVVSMSHYLEHTREPLDELDAAATALVPGGHLFIEVPDPEWPMGRVLKRFWIPWLQPQHQHLIPIANLKQALAERGLVPVAEQRVTGRMKFDLTGGLVLALGQLSRDPDTPWAPRPPGVGRKVLRASAVVASVPLLTLAGILDTLLSIPLSRSDAGVAYRVVSRKVDASEVGAETP
jgi:SAM-dependent methyltransferase